MMNKMLPCFDRQSAEKLKDLGQALYRKHLSQEGLFPLLLSEPERTRQRLDKAGALFRTAESARRYGHYSRALNYLEAFDAYCGFAFGARRLAEARQELDERLEHEQVPLEVLCTEQRKR